MEKKGIICTIISAVIYGFTPILARMTYDMGNNALSMTFYQSFFAIPALLLFMKCNDIDFKIKNCDLKNIISVSIFSVTTTVLLYSAYSYLGVGTTTTLHFMYPAFVALISKYVFNEYLDKKKIVALFFACIGIFFFIEPKQISNLLGILMAVASALTYSFYMVWLEKKNLVRIIPYKLSLYIAVFSTLTLITGNQFLNYVRTDLPFKAYILMIIVSLCTSFLATILLHVGISNIGSTSAALFSLFEPITSVISGALILREAVTLTKILGCTMIFLTITYLAITNNNAVLSLPDTQKGSIMKTRKGVSG